MEIRVLRYFLAVAREGNIAGAAAFLHLTQPTLSRQIRDLEEELGQTLLVRKSHGVALTAEGVLFRKRAEEILSMVDKTEAEFASMGEVVSGDIYIGGGETQAVRLIADIAREVRARHPGVRYHLFSGNAEDVTERLDKGLIDFGILIQPADISKYDYLNLPVKDRWGVVMRKDSPLARVEAVRRSDLLGVPLICSRQALLQGRTGNKYGEWFGDDFEKMDVAATFNLVYNACRMVEAGMGYALTIDGLADTGEDSPLCFRPLAPALESELNVVWKKYQVFSPAARLFLREMRSRFAEKA